ncbi:hypothetical protein [Bartonella kosoyi]|uniref:hypothetical protein n=1 Tax=Bartonella kosoyi TaxID=2133959 RepID=UPI001FCE6B2B|nr:hypothetical protein [Bartonella kosoyi]
MNNNPIVVRLLDPEFWVMIALFMIIIMLVLALYISVFKRMKMNFQVKDELERVLKENDLAMQQFWKDEAKVQERHLQQEGKEFLVDDDEILTVESATVLLKTGVVRGIVEKRRSFGDLLFTRSRIAISL